MNANELSSEIRRSIWERQNGMCALTGKKFEEFNDSIEVDYLFIKAPDENKTEDIENIVMVWKLNDGLPKDKLKKYFFPYSNFISYDEDSKVMEIKEEIDEIISLTNGNEAADWKKIRAAIRDVTNTLQSLNIPTSKKNEFKELLLNTLNVVNTRQTEELEKSKLEWQKNYEDLKIKVDEAVEFAENAQIFKEAREKLIDIQKIFRKTNISREHRNEFEKKLNDAFEKLNKKQHEFIENFEMECIENYHKLKNIFDATIQKVNLTETFASARDMLVDLQNQIKGKTLRREQKDEFFDSIRNIFDNLREKFPEAKKISPEEAEKNYAEIKPIVDEAINFANNVINENKIEQAQEVREKLIEAQNQVKECPLKRSQKDELFAEIRKIFSKINELAAEEREIFEAESASNYQKLFSRIEVVIVDIENAIDFKNSADDLVAIRTEMQLSKLRKNQRHKLYDKIKEAFGLLGKKRDEYNKWRNEEKVSKLNSTMNNLEQRTERLTNLLEKDNEILAKQKELFDSISAEDEQSKNNVKEIIEAIENRIKDRKKSLKDAVRRIDDIQKNIDKIQNKANGKNQNENNTSSEIINSENNTNEVQIQEDLKDKKEEEVREEEIKIMNEPHNIIHE